MAFHRHEAGTGGTHAHPWWPCCLQCVGSSVRTGEGEGRDMPQLVRVVWQKHRRPVGRQLECWWPTVLLVGHGGLCFKHPLPLAGLRGALV